MERASPIITRKSLDAAHIIARVGIRFVPVPVATDEEWAALTEQSQAKLLALAQQAEDEEKEAHRGNQR